MMFDSALLHAAANLARNAHTPSWHFGRKPLSHGTVTPDASECDD